jgi:conjugal transfer pilus assembly protein TraF
MNRALLPLLWVLAAIAAPAAHAQDTNPRYWSDTWRGWHFYEDPEPDATCSSARCRQESARRPASHCHSHSQPNCPRSSSSSACRKTVEQTRTIAIMRPTEANVRRYMELEAKVVARASTFADMAQRVAWATPELDPTLQGRPVNAKALEVFEQQQISQRSESIAALGRDHVLFFFLRGRLPVLPCLRAHAGGLPGAAWHQGGGHQHGRRADARLPGRPPRQRHRHHPEGDQVPAVYLAQPFTGKITPIGFGVLSEAQLLERITIVSSQVAEAAPSVRAAGRPSVARAGASHELVEPTTPLPKRDRHGDCRTLVVAPLSPCAPAISTPR